MSYETVKYKLDKDAIIILDGGTGTDIQRRGVPMSGDTWCADANATHPHIIREVHQSYIASGADIITANTFASSALRFNYLNRDADLLSLDAAAVEEAKAAARGTSVAIAGSISTMRPVHPGTDRTDLDFDWTQEVAMALFRRKASHLATLGVDFLMLEMMRDSDYSVMASKAALETGLPVWIGISVERQHEGKLCGFGRHDQLMEHFAPKLSSLMPDVMCIMHTSPNDTDDAIKLLKQFWAGPIGVYPESGYFKSPNWEFVGIIPPDELVNKSRDWQALGATIFGGCCGIGPDHIAALSKEFKS